MRDRMGVVGSIRSLTSTVLVTHPPPLDSFYSTVLAENRCIWD